jgi:putative NIF3 family GTP cyclohydrolase 1 type 2
MLKPQEVLKRIEAKAGALGSEEIILFGDCTREVARAVVCWMANVESIEYAASVGADLIICHEALYFPYGVEFDARQPSFLSWPVNARRVELLVRHGITCARVHCTADKLVVYDVFAHALGLTKPVLQADDFARIYEIGPMSYSELLQHVDRSGIPILRYTPGDMDRRIQRIGLPWGGLGLFVNSGYMEQLVTLGCDAFVAGESDSYGMHFARDSGVYMIETGHEVSENPGLKEFAAWLQSQLPELEVHYYETNPAYAVWRR